MDDHVEFTLEKGAPCIVMPPPRKPRHTVFNPASRHAVAQTAQTAQTAPSAPSALFVVKAGRAADELDPLTGLPLFAQISGLVRSLVAEANRRHRTFALVSLDL